MMDSLRIGCGYDVHAFESGRDLILGGTRIDYRFGLAGHSDADVLTHAIIDALAGASGLPDIGRLFPDTDQRYRDIRSVSLLELVGKKLDEVRATIINVDSVVICQEPKIAPHIDEMNRSLSVALGIDPGRIGIKGKSTEGLGFTGRGEGIAAYAVALVRINNYI